MKACMEAVFSHGKRDRRSKHYSQARTRFPFVVMLVVSLQITLSKSNLLHKKVISAIKVGFHSQCSKINKSYLTLAK